MDYRNYLESRRALTPEQSAARAEKNAYLNQRIYDVFAVAATVTAPLSLDGGDLGAAQQLLNRAAEYYRWSPTRVWLCVKLASAIALLDGAEEPGAAHLAEAIQYQNLYVLP